MGDGPGESGDHRLNGLREMITEAGDLIHDGDYEGACGQLRSAYKKCDGDDHPSDFATGAAAAYLANMCSALMETLGCE